MYHFIVNPNARSGLGKAVWKDIETVLQKENIEYQVHFTKYRRHATKIAAAITGDGTEHTLVVLGGDGSVGEVVDGIQYPEKNRLGYIPIGSSNDFARGLGLPKDPQAALDVALHSLCVRTLDLGNADYDGTHRRFAVSAGIGYDADICHQVAISPLKRLLNRLHLGKLSYVGLALRCLFRCTPSQMTVTLDNARSLHFEKTFFAAAMNLPCEGGGCRFCPDAKPDDGLLDLIVVADVSKYRAILTILPTVFAGKHTHMKGVHIYRCRQARVESFIPLPVHTDGEPVFPQKEITFSAEPGALRVIVREDS